MRRSVVAVLGVMAVVASGIVGAGVAQQQRGAVVGPPAGNGRAVVTLCGLAVLIVEDGPGRSASIYAGAVIDERLSVDAGEYQEYELAEVYTPVATACEGILAEHERILRERAASGTRN